MEEIGTRGNAFDVPEITKGIALSQLVPNEVEHQFVLAPDQFETFNQNIKYVRQRIAEHKARSMSARALKYAHPVHGVPPEDQPVPVGESNSAGGESWDMFNNFIMCMKGLGNSK